MDDVAGIVGLAGDCPFSIRGFVVEIQPEGKGKLGAVLGVSFVDLLQQLSDLLHNRHRVLVGAADVPLLLDHQVDVSQAAVRDGEERVRAAGEIARFALVRHLVAVLVGLDREDGVGVVRKTPALPLVLGGDVLFGAILICIFAVIDKISPLLSVFWHLPERGFDYIDVLVDELLIIS